MDVPSAAIGTVIREPKVRELAESAGFARVTTLDVSNDFFRLYRLEGRLGMRRHRFLRGGVNEAVQTTSRRRSRSRRPVAPRRRASTA